MNRRNLLPFLLLAIGWISYGIYTDHQHDKSRAQQVQSLALELKGIVQYVDYPEGYNGFGIVGVEVLHSNHQNLPIKNAKEAQYCVVKERRAEFYQLSPDLCTIGDTVFVNTSIESFIIAKANGNRSERGILLNDDE